MADAAEGRSLRYKITLAPARAAHLHSPPPPPAPSGQRPRLTPEPTCPVHHPVVAPPASSHALPPSQPVSNFIFAAHRSGQPNPPHPSSSPQPLVAATSLGHGDVATGLPCRTDNPSFTSSAAATLGAHDALGLQPPSPPPPPQQQERRYGGAILRISELRQQGLDVLLPTMTSTSARRPPASSSSNQVGAATADPSPPLLPLDQTLAQVFAATIDTRDPVERELGLQRQGSQAQARRGRERSRETSGRTVLELQPDGTPHEYRWYVQGGRRVLVYNNTTYKGKAAHRMWTQIKKAKGVTGGRTAARKAKPKSARAARTSSASQSVGAAAAPKRTRSHPAERSLALDFAPGVVGNATHAAAFAPIDLGDAQSRTQPRTAPVSPPSKRVPVKQPVRRPPASHSSPSPLSTPLHAADAPLQRALPLVARGLASLPFHPSHRAQTATARAADRHCGLPRGGSSDAAAPRAEVVEITDSDPDEDSEGPAHRGQHMLRAAGTGHPKRWRPTKSEGEDGEEESSPSSSAEWPHRYFGAEHEDTSGFTSPSTTDDAGEEDTSEGTQPSQAPVPHSSRDGHSRPRVVRVDGHTVVEMDGWVYPEELLPMLTQQQQPSVSARKAEASQAVAPPPRAMPRLPAVGVTERDNNADSRAPFVTDGAGEGGLTVVGAASSHPSATTARVTRRPPKNAPPRAGPETSRYADSSVLDTLTAAEGMDDLFDVGEEVGGFRF